MENMNYLVRYISSITGKKLNTAIIPITRKCRPGDYIQIRAGLYAKVIQKI